MSSMTGIEIYFKNEYMQYTGWYIGLSFRITEP